MLENLIDLINQVKAEGNNKSLRDGHGANTVQGLLEQEVAWNGRQEERGSSSLQKDVKLSQEWMQNAFNLV